MGQHFPKTTEGGRRNSRRGNRDITIQIGVDKGSAPLVTSLVVGCKEAIGETAAAPELFGRARFVDQEWRQFEIGDASGEGLGGLLHEFDRCGTEQQEKKSSGSASLARSEGSSSRHKLRGRRVDRQRHGRAWSFLPDGDRSERWRERCEPCNSSMSWKNYKVGKSLGWRLYNVLQCSILSLASFPGDAPCSFLWAVSRH